MRVLVAMSGGVDSSVAAALLVDEGHEVVGATMKLWGGPSDSGCCSVADVEDARRVAQQLGVPHHVFNFADDFEARVVGPYVAAHAAGRTPNPCVECNRHLKFDRFLGRAEQLGFDAVATGHHARVEWEPAAGGAQPGHQGPASSGVAEAGPEGPTGGPGRRVLRRGADGAKDQSYVLAVLGQAQLRRLVLPVGAFTKAEVRARAAALGLRTAAKPDSQDVCFITSTGGRPAFLRDRIDLHPGRVVDAGTGRCVGTVPAVELVTVGQRRGMGGGAGPERRYAVAVDVGTRTVTVAPEADAGVDRVELAELSWLDEPVAAGARVLAQCSAHGSADPAVLEGAAVRFERPRRPVAPGQTVALYEGDRVLGAGVCVAGPSVSR